MADWCFPGIYTIIYPNLPIIYPPPLATGAPTECMFSSRGLLSYTTVIPIQKSPQHPLNRLCNHLWEPKVSFWCSLPIGTIFTCIDMYWLYLYPLPLKLVMLFQKGPPYHPLRRPKTIRYLTNRKFLKSSWDTSRHHPSLSRELNFLHTLPNIISLETLWYLSLLGYFCWIVRKGFRKRLKTDPFTLILTLSFFDCGTSAENNEFFWLRTFLMPNFVCFWIFL